MKTFSRVVLRNSSINLAAQIIIKILSFSFSVLVVRRLGAQGFGQYSTVIAFGTIFLFISDLGLSPYSVRQVARLRGTSNGTEAIESLYSNVLILRLVLSTLTGFIVLLSAWLTRRPLIMIGAIALNTLGILMYGAEGTYEAMLSGYERLDISARAKVLYQIAFIALGSLAILGGFGYYGLIIANLASIGFLTYVCWRGVRRLRVSLARPTAIHWLPLLRASISFAVIGLALGLSYKFDSVLLDIYRGDLETGYYNAAYNLVFTAVTISNVFNTALYPSLSRQVAIAASSLPTISMRVLRYLMIISLPIAVGIWALANQLVPFLYSKNYAPAITVLQIIIWVVPFMFLSDFLGYVVLITGKEKIAARAVLVSSGLNVMVNLLLVPRFGFLGAAVMTVITEAVLVSQYLITLREIIRKMNWMNILVRPLLAALLMAVPVLFLRPYVPIVANIAIGGIVYMVFLLILGVIGRDDLRFVRNVRSPSELDTSR